MLNSLSHTGLLVLIIIFSFVPVAFTFWFCVGLLLVILVKSPASVIGGARPHPRLGHVRRPVPLGPRFEGWTMHHEIHDPINSSPHINPHMSIQIQQLLRRDINPGGESSD